ncbi:MAG: acetyl-CoA acetyltransferase [Endozoicomonas sp.]
MTYSLRGKGAIVGVGYDGLGSRLQRSPMDHMANATFKALEDAGLELSDIDGICGGTFYHMFPTLVMAEYLGIRPKWSNSDQTGGSSFLSHLQEAVMAIEAGLCSTVLIAYGSNLGAVKNFGILDTPTYDGIYGNDQPLPGYAMAMGRHMHQYGTTREQIAEVAVASRQWAALHPDAVMRDKPVTVEDVASSPMIATPIRALDCCLMTDGGAAIIVTSADRARHLKQKPVYMLGSAGAHWHRELQEMEDLTVTPAKESAARAFANAGVSHKDVDVVELYDAFTINTILFLEDMGFCAKGEGGAFVADGRIAPGGSLPVNTNGGGLSFAHPGKYGMFTLIEATEQLRGSAGDRQVDGAEIALAHGNGCVLSHEFTTILGNEATL